MSSLCDSSTWQELSVSGALAEPGTENKAGILCLRGADRTEHWKTRIKHLLSAPLKQNSCLIFQCLILSALFLYYIFFVAKTNNHNREQVDFLFSYLVQVALRIRPMAEDEIIQGAHPAAYKVENNVGIREF